MNELVPVDLGWVEANGTLFDVPRGHVVHEIPSAVVAAQNWMQESRSEATRSTYRKSLTDCLRFLFGPKPTTQQIEGFIVADRQLVAVNLQAYSRDMVEREVSENTINVRLSAVSQMFRYCFALGVSQTDGADLVRRQKTKNYRDTSGPPLEIVQQLMALPLETHGRTIMGLRDNVILMIFAENGLRRSEIAWLTVDNYVPAERKILALRKGSGSQRSPVTISARAVAAINEYLALAGHTEGALIRNLRHNGRRTGEAGPGLTDNGLWRVVKGYGKLVGYPNLAPHQLRHSFGTLLLDMTNGDIRKVKQAMNHASIATTERYDDNRTNAQGSLTDMLSKELAGRRKARP